MPRESYLAACLLAGLAVFLCGFSPPTLTDRNEAATVLLSIGQLRQIHEARTAPPNSSAVAVLVYDVASDRVLLSTGADIPISPASLVKLMTALIVLEEDRLSELVTVTYQDLVGEATMGLVAGDVLRVEDLLWGLLVPSGNDAAAALARHHSGDSKAFVDRMNARAVELNLQSTRFANPHGLDADGQVTNAQDLLSLTLLLWDYPLFRQIVGSAAVTVGGRDLSSTNRLLGTYAGANGVKTGTTFWSGQSLIAGVNREGYQTFALVLGSMDRYLDVRAALDASFETYERVNLHLPQRPTALDRVFDAEGRRRFLTSASHPGQLSGEEDSGQDSILLAAWERHNLRVYRNLDASLPVGLVPGAQVGVVEWRLGGAVLATHPLTVR